MMPMRRRGWSWCNLWTNTIFLPSCWHKCAALLIALEFQSKAIGLNLVFFNCPGWQLYTFPLPWQLDGSSVSMSAQTIIAADQMFRQLNLQQEWHWQICRMNFSSRTVACCRNHHNFQCIALWTVHSAILQYIKLCNFADASTQLLLCEQQDWHWRIMLLNCQKFPMLATM